LFIFLIQNHFLIRYLPPVPLVVGEIDEATSENVKVVTDEDI
jgi:hypothetical protein